jgi:hypothetical protein
MKGYFYLLLVLYVAQTMKNLLTLVAVGGGIMLVKTLVDAVLFLLCLGAGYALAFRRPLPGPLGDWQSGHWKLLYQTTFAVGALYVLLALLGPGWGVPLPAGSAHPLNLIMAVLNYVLFGVPAVLLHGRLSGKAEV